MKTSIVLAAIFIFLTPLLAQAQDSKDSDPRAEIYNGFYISLGQVYFDSKTAAEEAVDDVAPYIRVAWEGQTNAFVYGAGMSLYLYDDNASFEQDVVFNNGDRDTADSSSTAISFLFEGGYSHNLSDAVALEILGGYEFVFSSERSIDYCSDCYSEDIEIDAGAYVTPRIRFSTTGTFSFFLAYQQYLTGDVENAVTANFSWRY